MRHARAPLPGEALPPAIVHGRRSAGVFFLDAVDLAGTAVHQFAQPATITVRYTPEQLQALGLHEANLSLFWFDSAQQRWQIAPSQLDAATRTVSTVTDHFSPWTLSDGSSPSTAFIPTLQGFQANLFTGAASYRIPIDLPGGGLKPSLELSYSSSASDGSNGERDTWQASWVGKGWSLDPGGSVSLNQSLAGAQWDNFSFVING